MNTREYPLKVHIAIMAFVFFSSTFSVAMGQSTNRSSMSSRSLDGILQPFHKIDVATTEIGIVRKILVKPGDHVHKGQPLVELDCDSILAQIHVKEVEVSARGKIQQVQAELALQKARFEKIQSLLAERKVSQAEFERAQMDLVVMEGRLASEQDTLAILEADLQRFRTQLQERTIVAPMDGIVTEISKQIGEYVASNSPSVIKLVDISKLRATFSIEENELHSLARGKAIRVQLTNGLIVQAIVEYVPPVADAETGWFMISAVIENQDQNIIGSRCQLLP